MQQIPLLPHVHRSRGAHLEHHSRRLVNMSAEKVIGLVLLDELTHGAAAGVQTFFDAIERRCERRSTRSTADVDAPGTSGRRFLKSG